MDLKCFLIFFIFISEGLVQPCRIGEDGRPEPVDHILQLQEELPRQQVRPPQSAEDDDH